MLIADWGKGGRGDCGVYKKLGGVVEFVEEGLEAGAHVGVMLAGGREELVSAAGREIGGLVEEVAKLGVVDLHGTKNKSPQRRRGREKKKTDATTEARRHGGAPLKAESPRRHEDTKEKHQMHFVHRLHRFSQIEDRGAGKETVALYFNLWKSVKSVDELFLRLFLRVFVVTTDSDFKRASVSPRLRGCIGLFCRF